MRRPARVALSRAGGLPGGHHLVQSDPLDMVDISGLSRATFRKMIQNLIRATAYNTFALPLAAGRVAWSNGGRRGGAAALVHSGGGVR